MKIAPFIPAGSTESVETSLEYRRILIEAMRSDSDNAYGDEFELVSEDLVELAYGLLGGDFYSYLHGEPTRESYRAWNYTPDTVAREELLREKCLPVYPNLKCKRYSLLFDTHLGTPFHIKLIVLTWTDEEGEEFVVENDGILFFGKVQGTEKYLPMNEEEIKKARGFLEAYTPTTT